MHLEGRCDHAQTLHFTDPRLILLLRLQASELEIQRKEIRTTKQQTLDILSKGIGRPVEALEKDINRPKYFDPWEAVDYGLIDQVLDGRVPES
mmetsp:Transcript_9898/g.44847  ORF Transcript_9898/g.44847 Transcript_9898/m.44847 type:complete len:93 (+) Transcript_9898:776-1054(+)